MAGETDPDESRQSHQLLLPVPEALFTMGSLPGFRSQTHLSQQQLGLHNASILGQEYCGYSYRVERSATGIEHSSWRTTLPNRSWNVGYSSA